SSDPYKQSGYLVAPQSWNRYSYTGNDPVNLVDPRGLGGAPILLPDGGMLLWECHGEDEDCAYVGYLLPIDTGQKRTPAPQRSIKGKFNADRVKKFRDFLKSDANATCRNKLSSLLGDQFSNIVSQMSDAVANVDVYNTSAISDQTAMFYIYTTMTGWGFSPDNQATIGDVFSPQGFYIGPHHKVINHIITEPMSSTLGIP